MVQTYIMCYYHYQKFCDYFCYTRPVNYCDLHSPGFFFSFSNNFFSIFVEVDTPVQHSRPLQCLVNRDCMRNSICLVNQCQCREGYIVSGNMTTCLKGKVFLDLKWIYWRNMVKYINIFNIVDISVYLNHNIT